MLLSVLPDTVRTPLDEIGHPSVTAVWRPMDALEKARWFDATGYVVDSAEAQTLAVKFQLVAMEGTEVEEPSGEGKPKRVPFDARNPKHVGALPFGIISFLYGKIIARTAVSETDANDLIDAEIAKKL